MLSSSRLNAVLVVLCLAVGGSLPANAMPYSNTRQAQAHVSRESDLHHGTATFFFQNGNAGACGQFHADNDHVVALQTKEYANGVHCGRTISITNTQTGHTIKGVIADECPTCGNNNDIDLSQGLFDVLAPESQGTFLASWKFV